METKKQNYTLPIIVMIFLFGMISFVTNLASPMGDILKYQFNVPNWMGTLGVFANFIAYAIMGYPAGNMLQKYGYKKTALIAIAVGFTGVGIQTLSGSVESFGVYLLGAFIAGFSMCLLNTVVNPMLNKLGGGGNKGNQLIQAGGSFNSLCGTAVIILTGLLIPEGIKNAQISNVFPLMYGALAIFAFAFIVIALTKIPETQKTEGKKVAETSKYSPLSFRHFILGSVAIFVYVGVEVGVPNVLQKWLQNPELNVLGSGVNVEAIAGSVAATYWLLMLVGRLLGAMIGSKVSAKSMLMVVSSAGLLLTLGMLVCQRHIQSVAMQPLPFVWLSRRLGSGGYLLVALCLYAAALSTLCAMLCAMANLLPRGLKTIARLILSALLCAALARVGFGRIVQSGYPILGALCAALLLLLALPARQDASMSAR